MTTFMNAFFQLAPPWIGAITAIVAVVLGYRQLSGLTTTLKMNGFMAVLQIENEMNSRKGKMLEVTDEINQEKVKKTPNDERLEYLKSQLDAHLELYLNSVDRLAFCIRHEYVPEQEWEKEYREYIANVVTNYQASFGPASIYRNTLYMNHRWHDSGKTLR